MSRPAPKLEQGAEVGRVARLRAQFDKGAKAASPADYEKTREKAASNARAQAALYNMQLRGAQVSAMRKEHAPRSAPNRGQAQAQAQAQDHEEVRFELHEFTDEWQEYPWHLAAAFVDDEDAFWVPELAAALEQDDDRAINEAVLRFFFEEHDRERLDEIDALLDANRGREELLFVELSQAYAAAPGDEGASASSAGAASSSATASVSAASRPSVAEDARRRPSFIVSGMRRGSGWQLNAGDDELKAKMAEAGAAPEVIETVVSAAAAQGEVAAAAAPEGDGAAAEGSGEHAV